MRDGLSAFDHWLKAVGLPTHFPRLDAVEFHLDANGAPTEEFDDRFYFGQPHEDLIEAAIQSLAQPALANLVPDGQGATTLSRYVYYRSAAEASLRSLIPVHLALEDLIEESDIARLEDGIDGASPPIGPLAGQRYYRLLAVASKLDADEDTREAAADEVFGSITVSRIEQAIKEAIQRAIVTSLVSEPWERIIGRSFYAGLIGAPTSAAEGLESRRRALRGLLAGRSEQRELFEAFDTKLNEPWTRLMPELYRNANVRLSLQLDLSPSPVGRYFVEDEGERLTGAYVSALVSVRSALKNVDQAARSIAADPVSGGQDVRSSYMNRAFFMSAAAWTAFESQVSEGTEQAEFPPYSALDVFTILAVHFPRKTAGKKDRRDDLAAVLDSSLIRHANDKGLSTMIEELSRRLVGLEIGDVRFQLTEANFGIFGIPRALSEIDDWRIRTDERIDALEAELECLRTPEAPEAPEQ